MMKNLLHILFILVSLSSFGQSELAKNGLPKNANSIIVKSNLIGDKLFESIASTLFDEAYEIKYSDKNTGVIQTSNKNIKGGWYVRLSFSVKDNIANVRGNFHIPGMMDGEIENYGMKGSLNLLAFHEMDRIAKLISDTEIEYGFKK